ncbi:MAG: hypothetical protein FWD29_07620 [Micrococcales bacterium]|nr:hypothetical protein [Micrococcales bacterium]
MEILGPLFGFVIPAGIASLLLWLLWRKTARSKTVLLYIVGLAVSWGLFAVVGTVSDNSAGAPMVALMVLAAGFLVVGVIMGIVSLYKSGQYKAARTALIILQLLGSLVVLGIGVAVWAASARVGGMVIAFLGFTWAGNTLRLMAAGRNRGEVEQATAVAPVSPPFPVPNVAPGTGLASSTSANRLSVSRTDYRTCTFRDANTLEGGW